ncbi:MAG: hypothetical protein R3B70_12015 [Polyangiaceae bacterium]
MAGRGARGGGEWLSRRGVRSIAAGALVVAAMTVGSGARAQDASGVDEARRLYDRAAEAYERGDFAAAARDFAAADALAPSTVALATAIDAATSAGDAVLAMTLRDRAAGRAEDAQLTAAMRAAEKKFAGATGRIRVRCAGECEARVDGAAIESAQLAAGTAVRVRTGEHVILFRIGGRADEERRVKVAPDGLVEVAPAAGEGSVPPGGGSAGGAGVSSDGGGASARGLSPAWFFVGLGVTALAGGGTIASGVDTASKHDAFTRAGCAGPVHGDCSGLADGGKGAETRTNVLIGVTGVLAAATAVVGVGLVRWSAPRGGR